MVTNPIERDLLGRDSIRLLPGQHSDLERFPPPHFWTVDEYFAFESDSETRHEYIDGQIYDMTAGTSDHNEIKINAAIEFGTQIRGSNCSLRNSDMRVKVSESKYVYPDLSAVCGKAQLEDNATSLLNPILAVEVTSTSSVQYDRTHKLDYYRSLPSMQAYLVIDQHRIRVEHHTRTEEGWLWQIFTDLDDVIPLHMLNASLQLSQVYRGIVFEMA